MVKKNKKKNKTALQSIPHPPGELLIPPSTTAGHVLLFSLSFKQFQCRDRS